VTPLLEARGVSVRRGPRTVLSDVSVALASGEALAVVGPNAAGKSTLVRTLAGVLPAAAGDVLLEGRPLSACGRSAIARAVALVAAEEAAGPATLTVAERVALGRYPYVGALRALDDADRAAVAGALDAVGIAELAGRRIDTLSAGERQLAALARGLAQTPRALLLDEPGAHLDVGHQLRLTRILDAVRGKGVGVLMVVHDLSRAAAWADRLVLVASGRIAAEGPPRVVLDGEAAQEAFGVRILGHETPAGRVYSFEERG
jgi:iron complex transport system ATP-binding protein